MNSSRTLFVHGTVVDGTGAPPRAADVLVVGDRIAAVRDPGATAEPHATVIDLAGKVLCPGFIDVHAHDDLAVLREPGLPAKLGQGVTTVIVGNCGIAAAPIGDAHPWRDGVGAAVLGRSPIDDAWSTLDEYLDAVRRAGPLVNVAFLAGHNALRLATCGPQSSQLSGRELSALLGAAEAAMEAGALGISTGLIYPPGDGAATEELVALGRVAHAGGGMYVTHLRDEADGLSAAIDEALEIREASGCPLHVSHLKSMGRDNWGKLSTVIERLRSTAMTCDVYPYTAASTALMPALRAGGEAIVASDYLISSAPGAEELEARTLESIAREWEIEPLAAAKRIDRRTFGRTAVIFFVMCEADLCSALRFERTMIGSDGLPVTGARPHPRLYGTFPRVLVRYVRERDVLSLPEAVHRMTGLPAATFGLSGRGRIETGAYADIVVLDLDELQDTPNYEDPARHPPGITHVLVNGVLVRGSGTQPRSAPGRVLVRTPEQDSDSPPGDRA